MTWKTKLIAYGVIALISYAAWLTTWSVQAHLAALKQEKLSSDDHSFYYGLGGIFSVVWPIFLVICGAALCHEFVIGPLVRKLTRGKRTVDVLKKAT